MNIPDTPINYQTALVAIGRIITRGDKLFRQTRVLARKPVWKMRRAFVRHSREQNF